jgi:hypothetical protein
MADPKIFEQDLNEYLTKEDNLRREDKIRYLMTVFNKHFGQDALQHVISPNDLHRIISQAGANAAHSTVKTFISGQEAMGHSPTHIGMIEAVLSYLNSHSLLRRQTGFEYRK